MINYPDRPWTDGQSFTYTVDDDIVVGTYSESKNSWTFTRVAKATSGRDPIFSDTEPAVYPDSNGGIDLPLIIGDIWYDTSGADGVVKYVWDGTQWLPHSEANNLQTTLTLPIVNENGGLRAFAQNKLNQKNINFDVPVIANQYDANYALVEMIAAVAVEQSDGSGDDIDFDLYATRAWVADNYATEEHGHNNYALENHEHSQYATTGYVDSAVGNIIIEPPNLNGYATETWVSQNYAPSSHEHNQYATKAELPDTSEFITSGYLEQRIGAITIPQLPADLITADELETRLAGLPDVDLSNYATRQDFTALTGTITAAVNQVAANVAEKATQHDVALAATAVDAKFDMLRSAIREATDFDTLKARLLAVLE